MESKRSRVAYVVDIYKKRRISSEPYISQFRKQDIAVGGRRMRRVYFIRATFIVVVISVLNFNVSGFRKRPYTSN